MLKVNFDVVILEAEDILGYDFKTGKIKVDKSIFDSFVPNSLFVVHFMEDQYENRIYEYKMIFEDEDGIEMEYLDDYFVECVSEEIDDG